MLDDQNLPNDSFSSSGIVRKPKWVVRLEGVSDGVAAGEVDESTLEPGCEEVEAHRKKVRVCATLRLRADARLTIERMLERRCVREQ